MLAFALPLAAAEYVVLTSGTLLYADRCEMLAETARLYRGEGWIELPRAVIARVEPVERPAAPAGQVSAAPELPLPPPELVRRTAVRLGGEEFAALVDSVARVESGYRPDAISPKGARGLLQLMPDTAQRLGADVEDPASNVEAGTRLLRDLLLKYKEHPYQLRLALAAYNAGPGAVQRYGGVPPYRETLQYIERVLREFQRSRLRTASSAAH